MIKQVENSNSVMKKLNKLQENSPKTLHLAKE